jgi:hypothetical protein
MKPIGATVSGSKAYGSGPPRIHSKYDLWSSLSTAMIAAPSEVTDVTIAWYDTCKAVRNFSLYEKDMIETIHERADIRESRCFIDEDLA